MEEMAADDIRADLPRFHSANVEKNLRLRSALDAIHRFSIPDVINVTPFNHDVYYRSF